MTQAQEAAAISAKLVTERDRLHTLPRVFGPRHMLIAESSTYAWMKRLAPDYNGGLWNYFDLSNGGFYMAPASDGLLQVTNGNNWFEGELTTDAAGIVACLFAFNQLCNRTELDSHIELYHALREYASEHAERRLILRAID